MVQLQPDQLRKRITINSQKFVLAKDVQVYPVDSESQSIRTIGLQQRQNNRKINKLVRDWTDGLGYSRLRRDSSRGINGLRDADAETRFGAMLTLPLNPQAETHAAPLDHLISYEHFKGNLYGFFEKDYESGARSATYASPYVASSDTWTAPSKNLPQFNAASTANSGGGSGAATVTFAHTVQSAKADRLIMVKVGSSSTIADPTGVTYAGAALAKLDSDSISGTSASIWWKVAPATGANNVIVTYSGAQRFNAIAEDWWDVNQSSPFGTPVSAKGTATSISVSVTATRGDIVTGVGFHENTNATTPGALQTERADAANTWSALASSDETASGTTVTHSYSWTGSNLAIGIGVALNGGSFIVMTENDTEGARLFGTTVHKGALFAVGSRGAAAEDDYWVQTSTDGAIWAEVTGTDIPTANYLQNSITRSNDWSQKYADIMGFGTNLLVAIYEDPDSSGGSVSQVRIGYSANSGGTWIFHADLVIPCTDTPNISLISARDIFSTFGATVPALVTSDNIYLLDIANDSYQAMLPMGILGGTANEALAVSHASDASIYISKASGDILRIMVPSPGVIDLRNVGPHSRSKGVESDGLVTTRQGHASSMWGGDPRWLFVGYGGHASGKNGSVLCFDYVTGAWHSFYKDATVDRDTTRIIGSDEDDGVSRLHIATEHAAASIMQQFEEPYVSAGTGVAQQFRSTGYVEWAEDDLGDPHADSAILTIRLDADDLDNVSTIEGGSGTSTDVEIEYGVNGAAWDNVSTLGLFGSDDLLLYLGKTNQNTPGATEAGTPVGISAKTFRMRAELKRDGTATNTPKIKEIQTEHINKSEDLNGFVVAIDVGATAQDQQVNPEVVLDRIDTIKKAITSIPIEFGQETDGTNTTYYVEHVRRGQFDSEGAFPQGIGYGAVTERTVNIGTVTMYLEERIDV